MTLLILVTLGIITFVYFSCAFWFVNVLYMYTSFIDEENMRIAVCAGLLFIYLYLLVKLIKYVRRKKHNKVNRKTRNNLSLQNEIRKNYYNNSTFPNAKTRKRKTAYDNVHYGNCSQMPSRMFSDSKRQSIYNTNVYVSKKKDYKQNYDFEDYNNGSLAYEKYTYENEGKKKTNRALVKQNKRNKRRSFLNIALIGIIIATIYVGRGIISGSNLEYILEPDYEGIPQEIVEFGEKNPEARDYVINYHKYAGKEFDIKVKDEIENSNIPLFIQWDKRWGYRKYGKNYIGVAGCGPTCMAMIISGLTKNEMVNPYVIAQYAVDEGLYTYGQGTSWSLMINAAEKYGLNAKYGRKNADYILNNLSEEKPMVCSMGPGDFTTQGHFIVLAGIDQDNKIIVNDPNSRENSEKHWDVDVLVSQMKSIWEYHK